MKALRPSDLAREHKISTQAVRNYERDGFIPAAERTVSGYRRYTTQHAAALRTYLSLIPAYGHQVSGHIMKALHSDELDEALTIIDRAHSQLLHDRDTLNSVRNAIHNLAVETPAVDDQNGEETLTIGELAHRLRLSPATLRTWERVGILAPSRDPQTGYRIFRARDIRDADLAHLLRRGGYLLDHIATVIQQVRTAGGAEKLSSAIDDWQQKLTARGVAMLHAATQLSSYLRLG